jgi:hypothetical protein
MTDRSEAVEAYKNALLNADDDAAAAAVAARMTGDVVVETNFGRAEGTEAALAMLRGPRSAGVLAAGPAEWSALVLASGPGGHPGASGPGGDGDRATISATLPATARFGGIEFVFEFAGGKIRRVEQELIPPAPPEAAPLRLTGEMKAAITGALDNQTPVLIAYLDSDEEIHLSFRGTIQAYSDEQLALWARDPAGGLPRNIAVRPKVTLFYHDARTRTSYTFYGRARVHDDPAVRTAIYENSHPGERQMDFRRHGVAVIVDLRKIEGRDSTGRILMRR